MAAAPGAPARLPRSVAESGISLRQVVVILRDYWLWIGAVVFVTVVFAAAASKLLAKSYEATASLLIDFAVNDPLSGKEFPSGLANSYMATQVEFIGSPTTLLPVVDRLKLAENPKYTGSAGKTGNRREAAMNALSKSLKIGLAKDSRIIYVTAVAGDPQLAAAIANAVAEGYITEQTRQAAEPARQLAERYGDQLAGLRRNVDDAQSKVTEFRARTGLIDLEQRSDVETSRLLDITARLTDAQAKRREAEQRARASGESAGAVLDSGLVQQLKSQLATKEAELADLSQTLGPRHPSYVALQGQIATLRQQLQREVSVYGSNARSDVAASRRLETDLEESEKVQRQRVLESRGLQDEGTRYLRELETATSVYRRALENYDEMLLSSKSSYSNARLVSPATPPQRHSRPKGSVNVVLGLFAGFFFGIAGSLVFELTHRKLRCREDIESDLGLPVLVEL